jgi:two-component system response regulator PilR (NtrC family)
MARLLIIDSERSLCLQLEIAFREDGHLVETVTSGQAAKSKIGSWAYDVIISDLRMPDMTGIDLLAYAHTTQTPPAFILMTAVPSMSTAIEAVNLGAYQYVVKTERLVDELKLTVNRALHELASRGENVRLSRELLQVYAHKNIIGQSRAIQGVLETVRTVAPTASNVLVTGEGGTGKKLVARAIHEASDRHDKPFVSIKCGAFQETLLEDELIDYLKGTFRKRKPNDEGIIGPAHGGTLFLDEIGEMRWGIQARLMQLLHRPTLHSSSDSREASVGVRLIASTNCDLKRMVAAGQFREDFYYYVAVIPIHVPPLRERPEDIGPLAHNFLQKFCLQTRKGVLDFDRETLEVLERYSWPGNVRELENAIEYAVAMCGERDGRVRVEHLPQSVLGIAQIGEATVEIPREGVDFETRMMQTEKQYLLAALRVAEGVRTRAAELLHMSYRSFRHYAKKYDI